MKPQRLLVLVLLLSFPSLAAEPFLEKQNLFDAGEGGYDLYRIPGTVVTAKGTVLAYCEARDLPDDRKGADWAKIDILMRRSTDGGETWGAPRKIVLPPADAPRNPIALEHGYADALTINNPVAIVDRTGGALHFIYCIEYVRCYYMRSDDDGLTFSEPVDITACFEEFRAEYDWKVIATGPGHGLQLDNGRLLIPIWMSTGTGGGAHRPSAVSTIYSDDQGRTWQRGEIVVNHPELVNPSETVAVELANGDVMLNIRHETYDSKKKKRRRAVTVSPNGVDQWSPIRLDVQLPEPVCMASILRISTEADSDKNRILFVNPHNPETTERKNVTLKLSYDEGQTWPVVKALESGRSGYSDLAMGPDGTMYCFYERGTFDKHHHNTAYLCMARFNLDWLTDGSDSGSSDVPPQTVRVRFVPGSPPSSPLESSDGAVWSALHPFPSRDSEEISLMAHAGIGDKFPVRTQNGPLLFEVMLEEGDDNRLSLVILLQETSKTVEIERDKPVDVEISGVTYTFSYPSITMAATEENATTNKAMVRISKKRE
jgi:sialidase-1